MRKNLAILLMVPVLLTGCKTNETTTEPNQEPKSPYGQTDKTYYYYSMVHTQYSYYTVDFSEDFRTIKTQNVDNEERSVIYLTEDYQLKEVRSYLDATEESIDSKYIYLYDERGLLKQETCFVYDSEVGNGYIFRKTNYKYDDSGRVIEEAGFESLRPGLLTEDYLYEYRYEDNVFYEIHYDFDNFKKEFDIGWKTITSINELENRKTETYYKIDKNLQETQLDYISLYELDTGNELKTDFYEGMMV